MEMEVEEEDEDMFAEEISGFENEEEMYNVEDIPVDVVRSWQMLLNAVGEYCVSQQKITALQIFLEYVNEGDNINSPVFRPDVTQDNWLRCYSDFMLCLTNLLSKVYCQSQEKEIFINLLNFYNSLYKNLSECPLMMLSNLVKSLIDCYNKILETYERNSLRNVEVNITSFTIPKQTFFIKNLPDIAFSPFKISNHSEAQRLVFFISSVLIKNFEFYMNTDICNEVILTLFKKIRLYDKFEPTEVTVQNILDNSLVKFHPMLIKFADETLTKLYHSPETRNEKLEIKLLISLLNYPNKLFVPCQVVNTLRDLIYNFIFDKLLIPQIVPENLRYLDGIYNGIHNIARDSILEEADEINALRFNVLKKFTYNFPGYISLTNDQIRKLILKYRATGNMFVFNFLTLFMESELMAVTKYTIESTDNCSRTWRELKRMFFIILNKYNSRKEQQTNPLFDFKMLSNILNKLLQISLKQTEVSFMFFENELDDVVMKMVHLSSFCLNEFTLWEEFLNIINYLFHLIEIKGDVSHDLLSLLSGLLWLNQYDFNQTKVPVKTLQNVKQYSKQLEDQLGYFKMWPKIKCEKSKIIGAFYKTVFQTNDVIAGQWKTKIIKNCLEVQSHELQAIVIKNSPFIIRNCDNIQLLIQLIGNESADLSIARSAAEALPILICMLYNKDTNTKVCYNNNKKELYLETQCSVCNGEELQAPDVNINIKFNWLVKHSDEKVKELIVNAFPVIVRHMSRLLTPSDIILWIELLFDNNCNVSVKVAPYVYLFLKNLSTEQHKIKYETILTELFKAVRLSKPRDAIIRTIEEMIRENVVIEYVEMTKLIANIIILSPGPCEIQSSIVETFAKNFDLSKETLFWHCLEDIWSVLIQVLNDTAREERNIIACLERLIIVFDIPHSIFKLQLHTLIGVLIVKAYNDPSFYQCLSQVGKYFGTSLHNLIVTLYPLLYCTIFMNASENQAEPLLHWLLLQTRKQAKEMLEPRYKFIITELSLDISVNFSKNTSHIEYLHNFVEGKKNVVPFKQIIYHNFLATLNEIEKRLTQSNVRLDLKVKLLNSLACLFTMFGGNLLEPYFNKIFNIFSYCSTLPYDYLIKTFLELLLTFLKVIDEENFRFVIPVIVLNLTKLKNDYSEEVGSILNFILFESPHRDTLILTETFIDRLKYYGYELTVPVRDEEQHLDIIWNFLQSPRKELQISGLEEMYSFVYHAYYKTVDQFMDNNNKVIFKKIYGKLLELSSSLDGDICTSSLKVIGLIGAIDPQHTLVSYGFQDCEQDFYMDSTRPAFIAASFEMLVRELQSCSDSKSRGAISYVCQELMKAHGFQDEPAKAPVEIWNLLKATTQIALTPFFKSKYVIKSTDSDIENIPSPIFKNKNMTFQKWLNAWVCKLINKSNVKTLEPFKILFHVDSKLILFFLPQIFLHAIWSSSEKEREEIVEELKIAGNVSSEWKKQGKVTNIVSVFDTLNRSFDIHSVDESKEMSLLDKCSQVVLYLVDFLLEWVVEYQKARLLEENKMKKMKQRQACSEEFLTNKSRYVIIKSILDSLHLGTLAERSHGCQNSFRGLRYLDAYILKNREQVGVFLNLYLQISTSLNDFDLTNGILCSMDTSQNELENVLVYEMTGDLQKVIMVYELLLPVKVAREIFNSAFEDDEGKTCGDRLCIKENAIFSTLVELTDEQMIVENLNLKPDGYIHNEETVNDQGEISLNTKVHHFVVDKETFVEMIREEKHNETSESCLIENKNEIHVLEQKVDQLKSEITRISIKGDATIIQAIVKNKDQEIIVEEISDDEQTVKKKIIKNKNKLFLEIETTPNDGETISENYNFNDISQNDPRLKLKTVVGPEVTEEIIAFMQNSNILTKLETYISTNVIQNKSKALMGLLEFNTSVAFLEKYLSNENCSTEKLKSIKLEGLVNMQKWDTINEIIKNELPPTWWAYVAKMLIFLYLGNIDALTKEEFNCRRALGNWLHSRDFTNNSYAQHYFAFFICHILTEISAVGVVIRSLQEEKENKDSFKLLVILMERSKERQSRCTSHWRYIQQLLQLRRILLSILYKYVQPEHETFIRDSITTAWIESAKLAIRHRQFTQAVAFTQQVAVRNSKESFILNAMIDWESGDKEKALLNLKQGINKHFPNSKEMKEMKNDEDVENRMFCARAKLLIAEFTASLMIAQPRETIVLYKEAALVYPKLEETWIELGRHWLTYSQKVYHDLSEIDTSPRSMCVLKETFRSYSNGLLCGVKHIYESLSIIITIWANTGLAVHRINNGKITVNSEEKQNLLRCFKSFHDTVSAVYNEMPIYIFYICFYHINARLCHPNKSVYTLIQQIMGKLLDNFPHQMLWRLMPMLKLHQQSRRTRITTVLEKFKNQSEESAKLFSNYNALVHILSKFGFSHTKDCAPQSIAHLCPNLLSFFESNDPPKILMPLNKFMSAPLPGDCEDWKNYKPFEKISYVYISKVQPTVTIMQSLQKPKRFIFKGTDGNDYPWLIKVKDDMRIDNMVMQFMLGLNSLFELNPECKHRELRCRTYSVVPFGDDCGLIEWVPNLVPMRETIYNTYKRLEIKVGGAEEIKKEHSASKMRAIFEKHWLPTHPPVLGTWYNQQFKNDAAWYAARRQYIQSTAVMSMVGYVLGLGDRHGGNIMLDEVSGEIVHVDFNCLFNKGEQLPWPERVPFRLTDNMIAAMGATGVKGTFTKVCELTLKVIRRNMFTMLSIVRPVLYDALRRDKLDNVMEITDEFSNKDLVGSLRRVRLRMAGYIHDKDTERSGNPLSVEGQVAEIINIANDINNLSAMYPGWGAFI